MDMTEGQQSRPARAAATILFNRSCANAGPLPFSKRGAVPRSRQPLVRVAPVLGRGPTGNEHRSPLGLPGVGGRQMDSDPRPKLRNPGPDLENLTSDRIELRPGPSGSLEMTAAQGLSQDVSH